MEKSTKELLKQFYPMFQSQYELLMINPFKGGN